MTTFYLGAHQPHWLALPAAPLANPAPLFVSHRRLGGRRTLPRARTPWALDSGAFSELAMFGEFRTTPADYVAAVRRYDDEIGQIEWAAPQDWMVEPFMLAKTGRTVRQHQASTVDNYLALRDLWGEGGPFIPVLQGWTSDDYDRHVNDYHHAGVDLTTLPLVGVGSVCRRQHTGHIAAIVARLAGYGLALHGFGVKVRGLAAFAEYLASADSMAWSYEGRRVPGCAHGRRALNEANCRGYALGWRERVVASLAGPRQLDLFAEASA
jgi:hypothetical protein